MVRQSAYEVSAKCWLTSPAMCILVGYAVDKGSLKKTGPERFWVAPAARRSGLKGAAYEKAQSQEVDPH
jgi:hypothetical protein